MPSSAPPYASANSASSSPTPSSAPTVSLMPTFTSSDGPPWASATRPAQFRHQFMNPPHALNTRHAGKPDIGEQNAGRAAGNLLERLLHGAVLSANLESR